MLTEKRFDWLESFLLCSIPGFIYLMPDLYIRSRIYASGAGFVHMTQDLHI